MFNLNISKIKKYNYLIGLMAEKLAQFYMMILGYKCIENRLKTPFGEIDLVLLKGNNLVFLEVKYRRYFLCDDPISERQKLRINKAASYYISKHVHFQKYYMRFDAFIFCLNTFPKHIKNAWF